MGHVVETQILRCWDEVNFYWAGVKKQLENIRFEGFLKAIALQLN
jgi:hypothetical protein